MAASRSTVLLHSKTVRVKSFLENVHLHSESSGTMVILRWWERCLELNSMKVFLRITRKADHLDVSQRNLIVLDDLTIRQRQTCCWSFLRREAITEIFPSSTLSKIYFIRAKRWEISALTPRDKPRDKQQISVQRNKSRGVQEIIFAVYMSYLCFDFSKLVVEGRTLRVLVCKFCLSSCF
jgi:hypothetical protein